MTLMGRVPRGFIPIAAVSFLLVTGTNIMAPSLPVYAAEFGATNGQVGLAIGAFALGRMMFDLAGGRMMSRTGFRLVAICGCAISAVGAVMAATTGRFSLLVVARVVQGAGSAIYITSALQEIVRLARDDQVGRLVGLYQSVFMMGLILGPVIGGFVASSLGYRAPFWFYGAASAAGVALSAATLDPASAPVPPRPASKAATTSPPSSSAKRKRRSPLRALPSPLLGALVITVGVYTVRAGLRNTILPLYTEGQLGWDEATVGLFLGAIAIGNVVVLQHAGHLVDRRGRRPVALLSTVGMGLAALSLVASNALWVLLFLGALFGAAMGYAGVSPAVIAADVGHPGGAGRAIGLQRMAMDLGLLIGPIALGKLADLAGYGQVIVWSGLLLVGVALACVRLPETRPPRTEDANP